MHILKCANILIFQSSTIEDIVSEDFFTDYEEKEEELEAEQDVHDFYDYKLVCITVQMF